MTPQYHLSRGVAAFLLLHIAGSAAFISAPASGIAHSLVSRRVSSLPPLRYLNSEDERDEQNNAVPKKKKRRSLIHSLDRLLTDFQMTSFHLKHHPFLSGNYAPVDKELFQVEVEAVEGQIPRSIWGAFCRNGPNPKREWMTKRFHWFDGHAMLHTLMMKNGHTTYTNQYIPSPRYQIEEALGEDYFPNIGEYVGVFGLLKVLLGRKLVQDKFEDHKMSLPPNTSIIMYNNKLYCLHEAALPLECRMHRDGRLELIGHETFDSVLDYPFTAHPLKDGHDLLFHSYTTDQNVIRQQGMMKFGAYNNQTGAIGPYFVPTEDKSHVSFAHSFAHTDNYAIIWDCSVQLQHDALVTGGSFFRYNPKRTLKFGLIPKNSTSHEDVIWIDSGEPGAILHSLHAWEEVEEKFLNGVKISSRTCIKLWTPLSQDFNMDVHQSSTFRMVEFTIDTENETVISEVIDNSLNTEMSVMAPASIQDMELSDYFTSCTAFNANVPTTNISNDTETRCTGTLASTDRFGFSAIFQDQGVFVGYAKWDMMNRCLASTVYYGTNEIGGEPVVIRGAENELYVGTYIYNTENDQSYFDLYDAKTSKKVCRLKMPQRVPQGIHGTFINGRELESHFEYHEAKSTISDRELLEKLFHNSQEDMFMD